MSNNLILVINCGSSSLKFAIIDSLSREKHLSGLAECLYLPDARIFWTIGDQEKQESPLPPGADHRMAMDFIVSHILSQKREVLRKLMAIGHRIVHGGSSFTQPTVITQEVLSVIRKYRPFAPLHNPAGIMGIEAAWHAFPHLAKKNVAIFDTAFHQTMPEEAYLYALPYSMYRNYDIRRYGFHGISHQFVARRAAEILGQPLETLNAISCHLGNGASITAIKNGESIDTSMGLTPLEGLAMGTRCGDIDPSIIFYLYQVIRLQPEEIFSLLTESSGLLGLTEVSSDCRYIESRYKTHPGATRALKVFCYRVIKYIGAYATVIGEGLNCLIFTGGIGENSSLIRGEVVERLALLGFNLDRKLNQTLPRGEAGTIAECGSRPVLVIPTDEERMIAETTVKVLNQDLLPSSGN